MMTMMMIIMKDPFVHCVPTVSTVTAVISAHAKKETTLNTATSVMTVESATCVLFVRPSASQVALLTLFLDPSIRLSQTS
ncbi:hypothetical protein cypCar_00002624 [Cyprinus carpio]|nr:hypothetical protein cypCar_00002624 [Cyprinus carpio]